ncbi:hypothetical protein HDR61_02405 [bacterium]|nr:hypothetical protein [bacterium]
MSKQSGNFLLQALLALSLVFAFIPFFAGRLATRDMDAQMYAATRQIDVATTAARIFIRENASNLQYDRTVIGGRDFSDTLEAYGLPLGFVPKTALGQDIMLVIDKTPSEISAYLELSGGNMSGIRIAELARRIGFYATENDGAIIVKIALDEGFSDVVRRNENNLDAGAFLTDLDMGGFVFDNFGILDARRGEFDTATTLNLTITGSESGRREKNEIANLSVSRAVFQSRTGEAALALTRGTLIATNVDAQTVANYGDTGNFSANVASLYDFSMTAGRTGFTGPSKWNVHGNVVSDRINFTVERLDVSSYINMASGQDVYIGDDLEYNSRSGIETDTIITSNITLRDQTSDALQGGGTGAVVLDIRPGGTSVLPDAYVDGIDNAVFEIIADPADDDNKTIDCKSVISHLDGIYNQRSLSQYIICQYVFWQRLEQRINIKQCMMDGGDGCI